MVKCKSCRLFKPGTIGPGWCDHKNKTANAKDEACLHRVKIYRKRKPKLKIQSFGVVLKP